MTAHLRSTFLTLGTGPFPVDGGVVIFNYYMFTEIPVSTASNVDIGQTASDLGLHCLPTGDAVHK